MPGNLPLILFPPFATTRGNPSSAVTGLVVAIERTGIILLLAHRFGAVTGGAILAATVAKFLPVPGSPVTGSMS